MRDIVCASIIFPALFLTVVALGDEPTNQEPEAVALEQGEAAPFAGVLLPPGRAANLGTRVELCEASRAVDKQLFDSTLKLRVDTMQSVIKIQEEAATSSRKHLEEQLAAERARDWWESPELLLALGAIGGAAATVGAVYLVGQLRPAIPPASTP